MCHVSAICGVVADCVTEPDDLLPFSWTCTHPPPPLTPLHPTIPMFIMQRRRLRRGAMLLKQKPPTFHSARSNPQSILSVSLRRCALYSAHHGPSLSRRHQGTIMMASKYANENARDWTRSIFAHDPQLGSCAISDNVIHHYTALCLISLGLLLFLVLFISPTSH